MEKKNKPALVEDGWSTEPFKLIEKDGKMWGRGTTDDKGPVIGKQGEILILLIFYLTFKGLSLILEYSSNK